MQRSCFATEVSSDPTQDKSFNNYKDTISTPLHDAFFQGTHLPFSTTFHKWAIKDIILLHFGIELCSKERRTESQKLSDQLKTQVGKVAKPSDNILSWRQKNSWSKRNKKITFCQLSIEVLVLESNTTLCRTSLKSRKKSSRRTTLLSRTG